MTVNWEIAGGTPNFWLSDSIVVRDTSAVDFDVDLENPGPVPAVEPEAGTTCWIWVRVRKNFDFTTGENQAGRLRLFVGRAGPHFLASDYDDYNPVSNSNLVVPPDSPTWDAAQWQANLSGKAVVPIRWKAGPVTWNDEYVLDELSTYTPGASGFKWLRFEWEGYRVPPSAESLGWHTCLLAYIYDPLDPYGSPGAAYVESFNNFAQNNFGVQPAPKRGAIKRRVILGNPSSEDRRMGVRVWSEGPAARGAKIGLRFVEPRSALGRLALPPTSVSPGSIPRRTLDMRPGGEAGYPELRDAPPAWGLWREGNALRLSPEDAGFLLPVTKGEVLEAELSVQPGAQGNEMTVHLCEFNSVGLVPGGVSVKLQVR